MSNNSKPKLTAPEVNSLAYALKIDPKFLAKTMDKLGMSREKAYSLGDSVTIPYRVEFRSKYPVQNIP